LFGVAAKPSSLKVELTVDFHVGLHDSQYLFMDINSRYSVDISFLLARSGVRAADTLARLADYRRSPGEDHEVQLFAQTRTLRIR
jgi:hypothetical protein